MGKIERKNIFDLYKLRLKMYRIKQVMMIIIPVTFFMEIDWVLSLLFSYFNNEKGDIIFDYMGIDGQYAIIASIIFIVVMTYFNSFYKDYVNNYPCNSKTIYLSHFLTMNTVGIIWILQCTLNMVLGYGLAKLIEQYNDKLVVVNEMVVKNVLLFFVMGLMWIVFVTCIMQFVSTVFRKSIAASIVMVVLFVSIFICQRNNIIFDMAKTVVNFYCFENNIWVYICKILITSVVCFSAGLLLEINIKDSKNGNKVISAVLLAITLMAAVMGTSYVSEQNVVDYVDDYVDDSVETVRYPLNISDGEKIDMDADIESQMMIHGYSISALEDGETEPYVEIVRHAPEIHSDYIKDIYENMEFNVYIKNHKMHIESKQQNKLYLVLSKDVFLGSFTNRFDNSNVGYNTDVENYYLSSYEVNVHIPKKYIVQEESVGWD